MTSARILRLAAIAAVVSSILVLGEYGGLAFWPQLVGGFGASLAAFLIALTWERDRELRRTNEERAHEQARVEAEERDLQAQLATEVRRRFEPIRKELTKNHTSLADLVEGYDQAAAGELQIRHPQLLDRAWSANAPRLSQLMADYTLIGDLAITYGRVEELRWRLRQRTATIAVMAGSQIAAKVAEALNAMTEPLVRELLDEVSDLLTRVAAQIKAPTVQELGLLHVDRATVNLTLSAGTRAASAASATGTVKS